MSRLVGGTAALFFLTVLFLYFDPIVEDSIYGFGTDQVGVDTRPASVLDSYLHAWQWWVPLFIVGIFIYLFTAGRETDSPSQYYKL